MFWERDALQDQIKLHKNYISPFKWSRYHPQWSNPNALLWKILVYSKYVGKERRKKTKISKNLATTTYLKLFFFLSFFMNFSLSIHKINLFEIECQRLIQSSRLLLALPVDWWQLGGIFLNHNMYTKYSSFLDITPKHTNCKMEHWLSLFVNKCPIFIPNSGHWIKEKVQKKV